ncbi:MAG: undecaprenyl/decaprenyl-phosphate alpha-N-acetylglucosaminyl 1-phosphate transferase [Bacteroidales bacterium]|nr:undecaprenyl/decaprenyl-phosphate alpha-N-acetylglucosaminyl 1-phosphate transferase [Bacteroidales bacterium]
MIQALFSSFLTSLVLTFAIIPSLIAVAKVKKLYDEPNERTSHSHAVPTLGGVAFYVAIVFSLTFWGNFAQPSLLKYVIAAMTIVTFIGLKDDLLTLPAFHKLMGQMFAAMVLTIWGDIRLTSFYGIFGLYELPYLISVIFSILTILVIVNSFNLIDGINGLSASIGIVASLAYGSWFYIIDETSPMALLAFTLIGALVSFLRYNLAPSKIFMGDTGSLLLGIIMSVLAIHFIETNGHCACEYKFHSGPALAMGVLAYPLFDLLRSFTIRLSKGHSPFKPDRNHIHHLLLDNGFSHEVSTVFIVLLNLLIISLIFVFHQLGNYLIGLLILFIMLTFSTVLWYFSRKRKSKIDAKK